MIRLIAAIDRQQGLAKHGIIPWYIPEDEGHFSQQTKTYGGHVLAGSKTKDTYKSWPLIDRHSYILTRDTTPIPGGTLVHDLATFLEGFVEKDLWVAGGAAVFDQVMAAGRADELYLTHIDADFHCDQFFPAYQDHFRLMKQSKPHEQNGFRFTYTRYVKTEE